MLTLLLTCSLQYSFTNDIPTSFTFITRSQKLYAVFKGMYILIANVKDKDLPHEIYAIPY